MDLYLFFENVSDLGLVIVFGFSFVNYVSSRYL